MQKKTALYVMHTFVSFLVTVKTHNINVQYTMCSFKLYVRGHVLIYLFMQRFCVLCVFDVCFHILCINTI